MGFGGFGIAIVVIFLLVYLVPQSIRTRQVLSDTRIDERFAEDLRLVASQNVKPESPTTAHGKIFLTERKMKPLATSEQLRNAARERSRARARMAKRHAHQMRGLTLGVAFVAISLVCWIMVGFAAIGSALAIVTTAITGVYIAGFGYLVNEIVKADNADRKRIAHANKILRARNAVAAPHREQARQADAPVASGEVAGHEVANQEVVDRQVAQVATAQATTAQSATTQERVATPKLTTAQLQERAAAFEVPQQPSYTLKTVTPFVPSAAETADVPFRPTKLNERVGDEELPEARTDVLGAGSALDALLSRRRA